VRPVTVPVTAPETSVTDPGRPLEKKAQQKTAPTRDSTVLTALAVSVPSGDIETDWFTRMPPVRWWEYPVLVMFSALARLWVAIPGHPTRSRANAGVFGSITGALFAVACPVCNKRRCSSIVSFHNFGTTPVHYVPTMSGRLLLTGIRGADTLVSSH
jgi:hypothetical protein